MRAAVSAYMTDQVFNTLNVQQRVQEVLPPLAAFLATPLTGQVRTYVAASVNKVIASPAFAQLWVEMNRVAQKQVVAILEGDSTVVPSSGDRVTLTLPADFAEIPIYRGDELSTARKAVGPGRAPGCATGWSRRATSWAAGPAGTPPWRSPTAQGLRVLTSTRCGSAVRWWPACCCCSSRPGRAC